MKMTYRVLAWLIAALVIVQAATHAWFSAGASAYLESGGTLDTSGGSGMQFPEIAGIIIHAMNGMYLIPLVGIALVVVGYFTHTKRGLYLAVLVAVLIAIQVTLGLTAPQMTFLALLHGANALLIFGAALWAAQYMGKQSPGRMSKMQDHPENFDRQPAAMK
ncbi:hypothetical protein ACXZ66_03675 [Corynebacterium sp. S7]